jgi:hypothetical protein
MVSDNPFERPPRPLFPALAIPVENKQDYECPQEHLRALEQCIPQVTKLLIIGWRANENLFLDMLAKGIARNARIMVVSGTEEGAFQVMARISARWRAVGLVGTFVAAQPGFSNFIFSPEWEDFLKSLV